MTTSNESKVGGRLVLLRFQRAGGTVVSSEVAKVTYRI